MLNVIEQTQRNDNQSVGMHGVNNYCIINTYCINCSVQA